MENYRVIEIKQSVFADNLMSLCQSCHTKIHRDLGDR